MTPTCQCGTPVDGATLCAGCTSLLEVAIVNISAYVQDLPTVLAKLTRYGDRYGGRTRERSLPVDMRASEVGWVAVNTVSTWCRVILEERGQASGNGSRGGLVIPAPTPPDDTVPSMCRFLLTNINRIRVAEWGAEAFDELTDLERQLRRVVDRPAERFYVGPCGAGGCAEDLYARSPLGTVVCQVCGMEHDVPERRAWLLKEAEDRLETASGIARAVTVFGDGLGGEAQMADRIRTWGRRNRLTPHGHVTVMGHERALYRVGEILDLLAQDAERRVG